MRYVIYAVMAYVLLTDSMGAPFISRLALAAIIYFVAKWCGIMSPKGSAASKFRSMSNEARADPQLREEKKAQRQARKDADREAVDRIVNGFLQDAEQCAKRGEHSAEYEIANSQEKYAQRAAMDLRKKGFKFVTVYTHEEFSHLNPSIKARW